MRRPCAVPGQATSQTRPEGGVGTRRTWVYVERPRRPRTTSGDVDGPALLALSIRREILVHRWAPAVERVALGEVPRYPRAVLRDVVEVVIVLGPAAPRITRVVEEVRPDH